MGMVTLSSSSRRPRRTVRIALAIVALSVGVPRAVAGEREPGDRNCDLASTGQVPLVDLGADTYMDAQGGLYPQGSNEIPASHLALGLERAAAITPRNDSGDPDPSGVVAMVSIGVSNTAREFAVFSDVVTAAPDVDPAMVFVNAAQGGQDLTIWSDPAGRPWIGLDTALAEAGVTPEQVQAAWIKLVDRVDGATPEPFPDHATAYRERLATVLQTLQDELPNLQVAYLSSRTYGGYNDVSSPSPEPTAYEEGFGVKWTIERQMAGDPALNADPDSGPVVAPWIAWGPYLWADGTNPRGDGLTWECRDFRADGVHPVGTGNDKVAQMLLGFLEQEPTAAWMFADRELPPAPEATGESIPTSTIGEPPPGTSAPPTTGTTTSEVAETTDTAATSVDDVRSPTTTSEVAAPSDRSGRDRSVPVFVWLVVGAAAALALIGAGIALGRGRAEDPRNDT